MAHRPSEPRTDRGSEQEPHTDRGDALEVAADAYLAVLRQAGEVLEADLTPVDRTGIPVTSCSLLRGDRLVHHGNGYGADPLAARVGGLGELAEAVLMEQELARLRGGAVVGSWRELVAREGTGRVVDPRLLGLPAGSPWTPDAPMTWVEVRRVRTGEQVLAPVDWVASDAADLPPGSDPWIPPVTNGLGAGLDADRAIAHGLGEVLQRHTNGLRFRALDRLSPEVDPATVPPDVAALADGLREVGVEPVLKHAVSELGTCSTYVVGLDPSSGSPLLLSACGEAAHPDPARSLRKALLEYASSRARKLFCFGDPALAWAVAPPAYLDRVGTPAAATREVEAMRAWAGLAPDEARALLAPDRSRTVSFDSLRPEGPGPADQSPAAVLAHQLESLADHDVLVATAEVDGVVAAKVLVAGLEVEVLAHHRIGESGVRTSLGLGLDLVQVGGQPPRGNAARVHLTDEAESRLGGPAWLSVDAVDRVVGPLYPLYREPPRHSVAV